MGITFQTRIYIKMNYMKLCWLERFTLKPYKVISHIHDLKFSNQCPEKVHEYSTWRTWHFHVFIHKGSLLWKSLWVSCLHFLYHQYCFDISHWFIPGKATQSTVWPWLGLRIFLWFPSISTAYQCKLSSKRVKQVLCYFYWTWPY